MAKVKVVPPPKPEEEVHIVLSMEEASGIFNILDSGVSAYTVNNLGLRDLKKELNTIQYKFSDYRHFVQVGLIA